MTTHSLRSQAGNVRAPEELLVVGRAYREILRVAAEQKIDTIVMGVRGHGVVDRMRLGSTTDHVVRAATCPVLTIRRD